MIQQDISKLLDIPDITFKDWKKIDNDYIIY